MSRVQRITPCLWFDHQAEQAVAFYTGIFPNSRVLAVSHYGEAGQDIHRRPLGSVMTIHFELDGVALTAVNGGPAFVFNEALSLQVNCDTQTELDHFWNALSDGGPVEAQQCGWLKDRYGLSWQILPSNLPQLLVGARAQRVVTALHQMKKLDIATLEQA